MRWTVDLRQLRYFVAIAERGSFSAAANALHVAQSALSRHVQLLERELGGPLFERGARGVRVSESGATLLERARFVLSEVDNIHTDVSAHNRELGGTVRIVALPTLADILFVPIAQHFSRSHPRVSLQFKEALSEQAIDELVGGAADLALVGGTRKTNELVTFVPKIRERAFIFGPPGDPLLQNGSLRIEDVQSAKLVRSAESAPSLPASGQARGTGQVQTDNVGLLRTMVKAGLGYGVLPYSGVHEDLVAGRVSAAELIGLVGTRFLALPARRSLSGASREAIRMIDAEFARQIAAGRLLISEAEQQVPDSEPG